MKHLMQLSAFSLLRDSQRVLTTLSDFAWDYAPGTRVRLSAEKDAVVAIQCGSGNHEGKPVLMLRAMESWDELLRFFERSKGPVWIEIVDDGLETTVGNECGGSQD